MQSKLLPLLQRNSLFFPLTLALPYHPHPFNTNFILFSFTSICVPASNDRVGREIVKKFFHIFLSLFSHSHRSFFRSLSCVHIGAHVFRCLNIISYGFMHMNFTRLNWYSVVCVCACAQCTHPTYVAIGRELSSTSTTTKHFHDVIKYFVVFKCSIFRFSSDVGVGVCKPIQR